MAEIRAQLATLFRSDKAKLLAQYSPIGLVAVVSGAIIGGAVGVPAFATAGLGLVLTSFATSVASTLLYDAVRPDADDDARTSALQKGLEDNDPRITALVADTLAALGPQLAGALSDARQPRLLPALTEGMQRSGGVLAEVAPQLGAALADPQTDWAALQQQITGLITSLDMSMEASGKARITGQKQRAENVTGRVVISVKASDEAVIKNGEQTVIGATGASKGTPTAHQPAPTPDDPQHLHKLLAANIARLQVRELQRAQYGIDVPPHVKTEIDDLRAEIERLRTQVGV